MSLTFVKFHIHLIAYYLLMTHIFFSRDNVDTLGNIVSTELEKLNAWLALNRLSLSIPKQIA